ncbi:ribonuclease T [Sphingobium sp. AN558]|uniref:ribonuclease T2 family protein n=1 Tax=Sphingobium sp. AN558 TaxID=3133442 RepID=UPI0030C5C57E
MAQAAMCRLPGQIDRPQIERPSKTEPQRILPIAGYRLAISWSPQYCATAPKGGRDAFQCGGRNGQFAFTLHGLWPDGPGKEWPQYCRAADLLPRTVIRDNLCTTPSAQLLQHEWARHGTCMASQPALYFDLSRAFFQSLRFPDMAWLARRPALTVQAFSEAFAGRNRGMRANMIRVTTTRDGWLREVWLCMDRAMEFTRCPTRPGDPARGGLLRIAAGPIILDRRPAAPSAARPVRASGAIAPARMPAADRKPATPPVSVNKPVSGKAGTGADPKPNRRPPLILDLDPRVQPLTNSAAPQ